MNFKHYQRLYVSPRARVAHFIPEWESPNDFTATARCGVGPPLFSFGWYGTGDQKQRDRVEGLRDCRRCLDGLTRDGSVQC